MEHVVSSFYEWRHSTNEAGDVLLVLALVQIVAYLVEAIYYVWQMIRGKKTRVKQIRREWRKRREETVVATYRPEHDRRHPHFERQR